MHVSKASDVRVIIGLQDVESASIVNACKTCIHVATVQLQCGASTIDHSSGTATLLSDLTARRHTANRVQRGR
jgi:hypothetical protein